MLKNNLSIDDLSLLEEMDSDILSFSIIENEDTKALGKMLLLYSKLKNNNISCHNEKVFFTSKYIEILQNTISQYLDKFCLLLTADEIIKCLDIYNGKEDLLSIIRRKQEYSIVDIFTSDEPIPLISGLSLSAMYNRNIKYGFLDKKRVDQAIKKIEKWIQSEPENALCFILNLCDEQKLLFSKSEILNDFFWENHAEDKIVDKNYFTLLKYFYLNNPIIVNNFELKKCLKNKVSVFNFLENDFKKDGNFKHIQYELDNAHLWINREDFTNKLNNATTWSELSFATGKVTKEKPGLIFYYLMQKYHPKFIQSKRKTSSFRWRM